jgi:hypothetical protein
MSEYIRMQLNAFPSMTARILYAPSPETAEQTRFQNLELLKNNPEVYFQKTFDPATGDILSCAKWKIYPNGREEAKMDSPKLGSSQEPAVGWEAEAKKTFHHSLSRYLRDFMGTQPFYRMFPPMPLVRVLMARRRLLTQECSRLGHAHDGSSIFKTRCRPENYRLGYCRSR